MNIKKSIALFLVMTASLLALAVPASAHNEEEGISPQYNLCPDCGGNVVNFGTNWNNIWITESETKCAHYSYGTDLVLKDRGYQTWQCTSYGRGSVTELTRTKTECHGYNLRAASTGVEEVSCTHYPYGTDLVAKDGTKDCHGYCP